MKSGKYRYIKIQATLFWILLPGSLTMHTLGKELNNENFEFSYTTISAEAHDHFINALLYADAGDNLTSNSLFSQAIDLDPYFAMAYACRAFCAETKEEFINDTRNALSLVHKVNEFEEVFIYINETYITGNEDKRLELALRLTGISPDNPRAWIKLGRIQQERDEIEEARRTFEKARLLEPNGVGSYTALGKSFLNYEPVNIEKGFNYYIKAAEIRPDIAYLHISLGDIYTALNKYDLASAEYTRAISEKPENWIDYISNGYAKSCLGQFEEARNEYQLAQNLVQVNDIGYIMEALTFSYEGYPEKSLQWLEKKINGIDDLDLNDSEKRALKFKCVSASGWIALHNNKPDGFSNARIIHNQINNTLADLVGNPDFTLDVKADNLLWDGLEAALKGYYDAAIVKACDIKNLHNKSQNQEFLNKYHFLYGYVMYCQGRYGKAIEHLEQGDRNWVYNKYNLAKAYKENGESDIANILFKEVAANIIPDIKFTIIRSELKDNLASK